MSLTLTQQPTTPNAAYTRLVYVASGSFGFQDLPQFQYLMDIYPSGSFDQVNPDDNRIVRIAQVPNPAGVAVFDPSPVLQGQLEIDNNWKTIGATGPTGSVKSFSLVFGYQYGTSLSSSVEPIQILIAPNLEVFPGIVNENNGQSFNFNTSSYDISQTDRSQYLTNQPSIAVYNPPDRVENMLYMNSTDYFTATQLKDEFGTGSVSVIGQYYDGNSDTFVVQSSFFYEDPGDFITFGFGPQNLSDYSLDWANLIGNGSINHITTISDLGAVDYWIKDNLVSSTTPTGPVPCSDEYTRFAFINQYGFWDYYNVYNPVKTNTDLQRESFSNSFVNYSTNPSPYNVNRRGDTQTYLASTDRYSIDTDYINKETANWLEELMESPSVYLQEGANFVPIIITNTEYQTNNSTARNKLFQYTIEWEYANARRSRI
jgi:hypothetical protein